MESRCEVMPENPEAAKDNAIRALSAARRRFLAASENGVQPSRSLESARRARSSFTTASCRYMIAHGLHLMNRSDLPLHDHHS